MRFVGDEDQLIVRDTYRRFFTQECPLALVREQEATGYSSELWTKLVATGVLDLAGSGARLVERALIAHELGRALAPVPLLEGFAALYCLSRATDADSVGLLSDVSSGRRVVVVSPSPARQGDQIFLPAGRIADGALAFDGTVISYYALAAPPGEGRVELGIAASGVRRLDKKLFDLALNGPFSADSTFASCLAEWKTLAAAALAGLAQRAVDMGADYARNRVAFGVPIGGFQAVAHPLADAATSLDAAWLITLEAAWAADRALQEAIPLASMAFLSAAEAATAATRVALHVHGGYGIACESNIQLFFRRAKGWAVQLSDPEREAAIVGSWLLAEGGRRAPPFHFLPVAPNSGLDFSPGRHRAFRESLRRFIASERRDSVCTESSTSAASEGFSREFHRALGRAGYISLGWPEHYGGHPADAVEQTILNEELSIETGHHNSPLATTRLVSQTLADYGTEDQKEAYLRAAAAGEMIFALGYTEPGSGSDVAGARTKAVRRGPDWVVSGQKMFTTSGDFADYVFLLARTDPDKPKHRGLTMFLVPLNAIGVSVSKIQTMGGVVTTTTFYDDVIVSDAQRVGPVDGGWEVLTHALKLEHGGQSYHWITSRALRAMASAVEGAASDADPLLLAAMGRAATSVEGAKLLAYRSPCNVADGHGADAPGEMAKLYSSDALVRASSDLLDAWGRRGLERAASAANEFAELERAFLLSPGTTTYGGTVEVMRSLLAERHLGLPRSR